MTSLNARRPLQGAVARLPLAHSMSVTVSVRSFAKQRPHFVEPCDHIVTPPFQSGISTRVSTGYALTITAQSFLRDLCVLVDKLDADAEISEQLVTLERGESFIFDIRMTRTLTREEVLQRGVIQSANALSCARHTREI